MRIVAIYLEGEALQWHQGVMQIQASKGETYT